jgi:copper(I)-binding protein
MRAPKTITLWSATAAAAVAAAASSAGAASTAGPTVANPWARASSQAMGAAYMTITGHGTADKLVSASVPMSVAMEAQLHRSTMGESGMMSMKQVKFIPVPANGKAALKPGGYHVMLMKLKHPLVAGKTFRLTLQFEKAGKKVVTVTVRTS